MKASRHAATWPLRLLLRPRAIRRRLAFAIAHDHFADLRLAWPLEGGFVAPLDHRDALLACGETFLGHEYGDLLTSIPLPARWIDVGSHRGYFSLWVAWTRALRGEAGAGDALLIDADPRASDWFSRLVAHNPVLQESFEFLHAAVAPPDDGPREIPFLQRSGMGSSRVHDSPLTTGTPVTAPRLEVDDVTTRLAPPYDLVKVDIEGAELTLLESACGAWIRDARYLVVEWHGWGVDATRAADRVAHAAAALGFAGPTPLRPVRSIDVDGVRCMSGTELFRREVAR